MRTTTLLRISCALLLLGSMSSFSGCAKENVGPNGGCAKKAATTTTTTTTPPPVN
ncbi:MAG: hypothetical protein M3Y54_18555 [Bacteroidota bacterium]|nr:hypothetical protein [Bacteroidota bacterium]